ncbi:MAG: hypothetical protein KBI47_07930 [Armatimonadetes bacterium]|jgi:hypothetical protein|nr:hypothetical protein [Armatimonadota bacterium]MDI9583302.1 hypothetical protein [Acidobacteriota bacterium]
MTRVELLEWLTMIAIIVLWWPVVFVGWAPGFYRYPLYVVSAVSLVAIFRNRLKRLNEGFSESELMMEARRRAEDEARGGKPSLDEKQPPDVSDKLPPVSGRRR